MTQRTRWMMAVWLLAASGCGSGALEPQPLPLDHAECASCRMMISSLDHAAQAVAPGEEPRFYDDRGCLAKDVASLPPDARLFVQLDAGAGWIEAGAAFFAFATNAKTPMGYGVTAFRTEAEAARVDRAGRARRWPEVVEEIKGS